MPGLMPLTGLATRGDTLDMTPLWVSIGTGLETRADRPAGGSLVMSTERLARASARHPWRIVVVWIFVLAAAAISAKALLGSALTTQGSFTNRPESIQAQNLIEQRLTGPAKDTELLIVRSRTVTVSNPRFATFVTGLRSSILDL